MDTFILEQFYSANRIFTHVYEGTDKVAVVPDTAGGDFFEQNERGLHDIERSADKSANPVLVFEQMNVFFGGFRDEAKGRYFIWGPVALEALPLKELVEYRRQHGVKDKEYAIPVASLKTVSSVLSIAYYHYCGKKAKNVEVFMGWEEEGGLENAMRMEAYQLEKSEMNRGHNTVGYEDWFAGIVEKGDVETMKRLMDGEPLDHDQIGMVAKDKVKRMEYLCVASVTLVSRAAIRGGMNPELAYDLSDIFLQGLERCKTAEEMGLLTAKMQVDYTRRVRDARARQKGNIYVERCKDYVAAHLRKPFQVGDIAEALKVNRSYLSKIFTRQEGITIQQYVMRERLGHAENMLKYTDYTISVIAEYFCFASQSHFGRQFKEAYGMTPNEYRKKNWHVTKRFDGEGQI